MENFIFCAVNGFEPLTIFAKKTSLKMFDMLLNTPLDNTFQGIAKRRQKSPMHDFTRDFGFVIKK